MMLHLDNALARVLAIALLVGGFGFPAVWADSDTVVTDPDCTSDPVDNGAPDATTRILKNSSLAAGCGAEAYGEGSVAIGDDATAKTKKVTKTFVPPKGSKPAMGILTIDGRADPVHLLAYTDDKGNVTYSDAAEMLTTADARVTLGEIIRLATGRNKDDPVPGHRLEIDPATIVVNVANGTLKVEGNELQVLAFTLENGDVTYCESPSGTSSECSTGKLGDRQPIGSIIREWRKLGQDDEVPEHTLAITKETRGRYITADVAVAVVDAVAVGSGATVKGNSGIAIGSGAQVGRDHDDDPMYTDRNSANGIAVGTDASVYGESTIAIGTGAEVNGKNGIAIGWGAQAGENEITIGNAHHQKVTIGGMDFVTEGSAFSIGQLGQTATIAGINLNQASANISANSLAISNNAMAISENAFSILDNTGQISANASAISGFSERILEVDERVRRVAAMAAALSAVPNVVPNGSDGDFYVGMGFGNHDGEQGVAVGVSGRLGSKRNILFNAGAAQSGGETSARMGFGLVW